MLKRTFHATTLLTAFLFLLPSCSTRSGIHLGKRYESSDHTVRYVFNGSGVDVYWKLKEFWWGMKIGNTNRIVSGEYRIPVDDEYDGKVFLLTSDIPIDQIPVTPVSKPLRYYKPSDFDAKAIAKPGEWFLVMENAPAHIEEHSMRVDFGACHFGTACSDAGFSDSIIYNIESDGMILRSSQNQNYIFKLTE